MKLHLMKNNQEEALIQAETQIKMVYNKPVDLKFKTNKFVI